MQDTAINVRSGLVLVIWQGTIALGLRTLLILCHHSLLSAALIAVTSPKTHCRSLTRGSGLFWRPIEVINHSVQHAFSL